MVEFRRGDSLPDGPANDCEICLSLYTGRVFDLWGKADSAILQYEYYLNRPYSNRLRIGLDPLSLPYIRERLGQLYAAKGNAPKAIEHYRAFMELWKNADAPLQPRVTAARQRVAALSPVTNPK